MRNVVAVREGMIWMRWFALIVGMLAVLAGCGGGGSSSPSGTGSTTGRATFTIQWPDRNRLIPVAANSIRVRISSSTSLIVEQILPRPSAGGSVTTTLNGVPVGQFTLTASAYPQIDGTGTAQATATSPITIQAGKATAITLSLESTIARLEVTPPLASVIEGKTVSLTATAKDAANAIVLTSAFAWSSADTSVATVNSEGVVTAAAGAAGNATTITVTETESGKSATVAVNVIAETVSSQKATTYQINPAHNGSISFEGPLTFPNSPTWSVDLGGKISYPLIADGRVFVTTPRTGGEYGTRLYALNAATGQVLWGPVIMPGTYYWSGLTYDNGKVFVVNFDGTLRSFDAATGAPGWSVQLPGQYAFSAAPNAVNGTVYVGGAGSGGTLYAVNAANGDINWTANVQNGDQSSPAITLENDGVFVSYPCQVYRFDTLTGTSDWHYDGPCGGGGGKTAAYRNGLLYVRDNSVGTIGPGIIYDAVNGAQVGSFNGAGPIPALSATTDAIMNQGTLRGLDSATRQTLWSFAGDGQLTSAPIIVNQTVIVGSGSGMVYALDAVTGATVWSNSAGAPIDPPDEQNSSQPLTGLAAGEGYLVVPAGTRLTAWRIVAP